MSDYISPYFSNPRSVPSRPKTQQTPRTAPRELAAFRANSAREWNPSVVAEARPVSKIRELGHGRSGSGSNTADGSMLKLPEPGDAGQWRRQLGTLVRQIYSSKFILGDSLEGADPMFDQDASGDLHANAVPLDKLAAADGGGDAVELRGKLEVAEGVIRKLYAKSMEVTRENVVLKQENDRLTHLLGGRPHSSQEVEHAAQQPRGGGLGATSADVEGKKGDGDDGEDEEQGGAKHKGRRTKLRERDGAVSAPVDEWNRYGGGAAIEGGTDQKFEELQRQLRRAERREAALKTELEHARQLEVLVWSTPEDGEGGSGQGSAELISQLRARLQAARRLLSSMGKRLQQEMEARVGAEEDLQAKDKLLQRRLRMYVRHKDSLVSRAMHLLESGPPRGVGRRESSLGGQQEALEGIRAHAHAIGKMIKDAEGERNAMEDDDGESDDEDRDVGFDTSDLNRTIEMVSLSLPAETRTEMLELMRVLYHRFHLLKMETDALQEAYAMERDDGRKAVKSLLQDRSILRAALVHMAARAGADGLPPEANVGAGVGAEGARLLLRGQDMDDGIEAALRGEDDGVGLDEDEEVAGLESPLEDGKAAGRTPEDGDVAEGEGVQEWGVRQANDGTVYEGCLQNGKACGPGTETYPDGAAYEGEFRDGLRDGVGAYYFANGKVYEGEWQDSCRHGVGIERQVDGDRRLVLRLMRYKHGALQSSAPLDQDADEGESEELQLRVLDAVEDARRASREARLQVGGIDPSTV